ncbi:nardilysin-like [Branchiostoma lanceolatum]|uniref:nardilysin-like n=1 Tax=Branchiostoma lanceolatum TaxID=7740 RepID=UPI003452C430
MAEVEKSPNDKKEYRVITLANGLQALLISDQLPIGQQSDDVTSQPEDPTNQDEEEEMSTDGGDENAGRLSGTSSGDAGRDPPVPRKRQKTVKMKEKLSAAALCVGVGSFSDPDDLPGLAHYLEHMVFMGSEKYPDENAFDVFIKKHGGSDNASTDCERTVFQFEIQRKFFKEALDRWAQFFISPLLKVDSLEREVKAVDSEFQMNLPVDSFRKQQLFSTMVKVGHPMAKFMWGNLASLKQQPEERGINVHQRLGEFRRRFYSAQYMTLAVQSAESLDTLEEWVREVFSAVPNNGCPAPNFDDYKDTFDTPNFYKLYKMVPVKSVNQLEITWSLPCQMRHYRVKPLHYLGWLLGHEGTGSIFNLLKKKMWALGLYAGNNELGFEHNSTNAVLNVVVVLTDDGLAHAKEVITIVFQYISMLQRMGPSRRVYEEIQTIEDKDFRFKDETDPIDYVENVCENMQMYPPQHYLTGDILMFQYDQQVLAEVQNLLTPDRASLLLVSPQFKGECDLRERWFDTPYCVSDIPNDWKEAWKDLPENPELHLPAENRFIAKDFSLKEHDLKDSKYPKKILDTPQSRLWYRPDTKFHQPKAYVHFYLKSPLIGRTPQSVVLLDLFLNLLAQNLTAVAYDADVAQLSYKFVAEDSGMVIKLSGFNEKLPLLFETIVDYMADFSVSEEMFQAVKTQLRRSYYNHVIKPMQLVRDVRLSILEKTKWTTLDKRQAMRPLEREDVLQFVDQFRRKLYVEGLVQGNYTHKEALKFEEYLVRKLSCAPVPRTLLRGLRVMQVPLSCPAPLRPCAPYPAAGPEGDAGSLKLSCAPVPRTLLQGLRVMQVPCIKLSCAPVPRTLLPGLRVMQVPLSCPAPLRPCAPYPAAGPEGDAGPLKLSCAPVPRTLLPGLRVMQVPCIKLSCAPVPRTLLQGLRVMQVPLGDHVCRFKSFHRSDANSVITNYYQSSPGDIRRLMLMELLVMLMEEPCFDYLRTQEQLGYAVFPTCRDTAGILGFSVTVQTQATNFSVTEANAKMEKFLEEFDKILKNMTEENFAAQVTALVTLKLCADLHLGEEVDRNWEKIVDQTYLFNRLEREISALHDITLGQLQDWYQQHSFTDRHKLSIQVVGEGGNEALTKVREGQEEDMDAEDDSDSADDDDDEDDSEEEDEEDEEEMEEDCPDTNGTDELDLQLEMLPVQEEEEERTNISDIPAFKRSLMVFPVTLITS